MGVGVEGRVEREGPLLPLTPLRNRHTHARTHTRAHTHTTAPVGAEVGSPLPGSPPVRCPAVAGRQMSLPLRERSVVRPSLSHGACERAVGSTCRSLLAQPTNPVQQTDRRVAMRLDVRPDLASAHARPRILVAILRPGVIEELIQVPIPSHRVVGFERGRTLTRWHLKEDALRAPSRSRPPPTSSTPAHSHGVKLDVRVSPVQLKGHAFPRRVLRSRVEGRPACRQLRARTAGEGSKRPCYDRTQRGSKELPNVQQVLHDAVRTLTPRAHATAVIISAARAPRRRPAAIRHALCAFGLARVRAPVAGRASVAAADNKLATNISGLAPDRDRAARFA
jgi:hypothetical protein